MTSRAVAPTPTTFVVLLRGINVGPNKRMKMADLRAMCEDGGYGHVSTYIQSGNVLLTSASSEVQIVADLEERILARFGFDVSVVVRTEAEVAAAIGANPYPDEVDPTKLVLAFMASAPPPRAFASIDPAAFAPETFTLVGRDLYLHLPNGQGRAKLTAPHLAQTKTIPTTARNWKSVTTLLELARQTSVLAAGPA